MRLSDAIALGSTMVKMKPCMWESCPLGVAAKAVGVFPEGYSCHQEIADRIMDEWPWLRANEAEGLRKIMKLFDWRVCDGDLTLNDLIYFVRQIEPPCECGVRNCVCARVEGLLETVEELQEVAQ
jgi:hypothetical protein